MKEYGRGSLPLKILAFFFSGVFFAVIVLSLCILSLSSLFGISSGTGSFYDSPVIRDLAISHADDIVSSYINLNDGDYMSMNVYDEESSNISYTLYAPQEPGSLMLEKKAENYICEKSGYTKTLVYHPYNLQHYELERLGFDPAAVSSADVLIRIIIRVSDPVKPVDDLYYYSRRFDQVRQYVKYVPYFKSDRSHVVL